MYDSVIFIPATPNSELKKVIEEEAKACALKIRVVEKPGKKLIDYLKSFDKTNENPKCEEKDCLTCGNGEKKGGHCRKHDIVYKIACEECETNKKSANYYGDTHFNAYTRGKIHLI